MYHWVTTFKEYYNYQKTFREIITFNIYKVHHDFTKKLSK